MASSACSLAARIMDADPMSDRSRAERRDCLAMRTRLALANGEPPQALRVAEAAVHAAQAVRSTDRADDRHALARAYRLLGDVKHQQGDRAGAAAAWQAALAAFPRGVPEKPTEMTEHATVLQRLGRVAEARALAAKLAQMGFGK